MKIASYLVTAFLIYLWGLSNLVGNTLVLKSLTDTEPRFWVLGTMFFTGIIPLLIGFVVIFKSGIFAVTTSANNNPVTVPNKKRSPTNKNK